jgi:hypothetical protein
MGFSAKQLQALRRNPTSCHIRTREVNGRELSYLEGWYVISEANRIFGFDGWSRETLESRCVLARENRGTFLAVYLARVRVTVQADGATIIREGHGTGEGRVDLARRGPRYRAQGRGNRRHQTRARKFGKPFGLELYRHSKTTMAEKTAPATLQKFDTTPRLGFHPDDTTPIPRPSRYYGRRQNLLAKSFRDEKRQAVRESSEAPPLAPAAPAPVQIDKSILSIAEPKRLRDKAHLKFVASQPCLVCGRQPTDPHHLRFAQPRALGMKVSDEFTVPLCRGHHRQLHQAGNEVAWWKDLDINALEIAKGLWEQNHTSTSS